MEEKDQKECGSCCPCGKKNCCCCKVIGAVALLVVGGVAGYFIGRCPKMCPTKSEPAAVSAPAAAPVETPAPAKKK